MTTKIQIQRLPGLTIIHPKQHKHTLIWIHGLAQHHERNLRNVMTALGDRVHQFKIIMPRAPDRHVTVMNSIASSWFDIKFRNQKSFIVPFDEAFSSQEVIDSYQKVLLPIIQKESKCVKQVGGKLIVAGFSQGCGMSIHCLYNTPELVDYAIGIAGYFFPITKYDPAITNPLYIIYGTTDDLRPWEYSKVTYYGKVPEGNIHFVPQMKHQVNRDTQIVLGSLLNNIMEIKAKI